MTDNSSLVVFAVLFIIIVTLFVKNCSEDFYIEPNTVVGGAMPQSGMVIAPDGQYDYYNAPLELEGPGDAAWSGY